MAKDEPTSASKWGLVGVRIKSKVKSRGRGQSQESGEAALVSQYLNYSTKTQTWKRLS